MSFRALLKTVGLIRAPLAHIHLDIVLTTVVLERNHALWSPCPVYACPVYHGTVQRYPDRVLRLFRYAFDPDVIDRLAIAIVDFVRFPMIRDTRCDAQMVYFQLHAQQCFHS